MKILPLVALFAFSSASAAGWEYATFLLTPEKYEWLGPAGQKITDSNFSNVITKMGCKLPAPNSGNDVDLLNCAGKSNWEFTAIEPEPVLNGQQWIFKRPKK